MPSARDWPTNAEHTRQDYIALALDVQYLAAEAQRALLAGNTGEAMRLLELQHRVGAKQQKLMKEARHVT